MLEIHSSSFIEPVCLSTCVSLSLSLSTSLYHPRLSLSTCLCPPVSLYLSVSTCLSLPVSLYLSVSQLGWRVSAESWMKRHGSGVWLVSWRLWRKTTSRWASSWRPRRGGGALSSVKVQTLVWTQSCSSHLHLVVFIRVNVVVFTVSRTTLCPPSLPQVRLLACPPSVRPRNQVRLNVHHKTVSRVFTYSTKSIVTNTFRRNKTTLKGQHASTLLVWCHPSVPKPRHLYATRNKVIYTEFQTSMSLISSYEVRWRTLGHTIVWLRPLA